MKKILSVFLFVQLSFIGVQSVFSASDRCVVTQTQGNTVVLECSKKIGNFNVDDKVKVKSVRIKNVKR